MTYRLVGLMSLVLLICLAAFAFLTDSYQAEVMDGVNRTISEASRATLRTLDFRFDPEDGPPAVPVDGARVRERQHRLRMQVAGDELPGEISGDVAGVDAGASGFGMVIVTRFGDAPMFLRREKGCEGVEEDCAAAPLREVLQVQVGAEGQKTPPEGITAKEDSAFFIQVDQVRTEVDPAKGTVLRIPALFSHGHAWAATTDEHERIYWTSGPDAGAAVGAPPRVAAKQDIVLPIETDEFQALFTSFRQRMLLMFLGVFVLGMVLSAGLATRFTRPIRRLDAGIRRLSDGDLEVEVEAHGRDEVGRLGRAFNEMTRRLRASRQRERELTRREKLSALGRLAAGVAHDVRNPLHSIGLTLQNLHETCRPEDGGKAREFARLLDVIRREIHRLDRLVGNFLQFARSDRRSRQAIDLVQLLRDTAALVEKEAERRGIRLQIVTHGEVRPFAADAESIRSSILNLVMNSFEAMSDGGTLTLEVRGGPDEVAVEVVDTGRGIPEEDQERVFEFAYTTREDGHGLGLAMVHQVVVEDHGGRVSLESRPGEGTRVLMAFPLLPAGAGA